MARDALKSALDNQAQLDEGVQKILEKMARDEPVSMEEVRLAHQRFPGFQEVERRVGKVRSAFRHKATAGTAEYRNGLREQVMEAEDVRRTEKPELEAQQQAIEKRLKELDTAVEEPQRKLADAESAKEALRSDGVLPDFIVEDITRLRGYLKRQFHDVVTMGSRLNSIDSQLQLTDQRKIVQILEQAAKSDRSLDPYGAASVVGAGSSVRSVLKDHELKNRWGRYCDQLRAERDELQPEYDRRSAEREAAFNELDSRRDYYLRDAK